MFCNQAPAPQSQQPALARPTAVVAFQPSSALRTKNLEQAAATAARKAAVRRAVRIPQELYVSSDQRNEALFHVQDPIVRFQVPACCNCHLLLLIRQAATCPGSTVWL
jgi:hypothetical protein